MDLKGLIVLEMSSLFSPYASLITIAGHLTRSLRFQPLQHFRLPCLLVRARHHGGVISLLSLVFVLEISFHRQFHQPSRGFHSNCVELLCDAKASMALETRRRSGLLNSRTVKIQILLLTAGLESVIRHFNQPFRIQYQFS
jgi:hypothetical protein